MKNIKVLGTGCAKCKTTLKLIQDAAAAEGIQVELEKVEDLSEIMSYGVMSTPGVVMDGVVVHSGGVPGKVAINSWLKDASGDSCCSDSGQSGQGGCCG